MTHSDLVPVFGRGCLSRRTNEREFDNSPVESCGLWAPKIRADALL